MIDEVLNLALENEKSEEAISDETPHIWSPDTTSNEVRTTIE